MVSPKVTRAVTRSALCFKEEGNLPSLFEKVSGYSVRQLLEEPSTGIFFDGRLVARAFLRSRFSEYLIGCGLERRSIDSAVRHSRRGQFLLVRDLLFVIDQRCRQRAESTYEKLQTCDFKRKQYLKLVSPLGLKVEYVYVLSDWFKNPCYRDVLDYIHSVNCHYKFNELPLAWLGLPAGKT